MMVMMIIMIIMMMMMVRVTRWKRYWLYGELDQAQTTGDSVQVRETLVIITYYMQVTYFRAESEAGSRGSVLLRSLTLGYMRRE